MRAVLLLVLLATRPEEAGVEQPEGDCQNPVAVEVGPSQVESQLLSDAGQSHRKLPDPLVLQ